MFDKILDKFSKTKKLISKELLYSFYNIVSQEIQQGTKDEGVWAKSFADAQGDEQKTKAIYIELMVERLILKHEAELELKKKEEKSKQIEREQQEKRNRLNEQLREEGWRESDRLIKELQTKSLLKTKIGSILNIIFAINLLLVFPIWVVVENKKVNDGNAVDYELAINIFILSFGVYYILRHILKIWRV